MSGCCYMLITADHRYWYVGSTDNPKRRLKSHMSMLRAGKHHCQRLQRVFDSNRHGALEFKILVECASKSGAEEYEQEYLDFFFGKDECLNTSSNAFSAGLCPDVVAKRVAKVRRPEFRAAASEKARRWRAENPARAAEIDRRSASTRRSEAARAANSARGALQASAPGAREAFIERMRRHRETGAIPNARPVIRVSPDGTETQFPSAAAAARATPGSAFQAISRVCRGQGKTNAGYGWRFA